MNKKKQILPSEGKYKNARLSLLLILILSVVNIGVLFADMYFPFSARISLVLASVGIVLKAQTGEVFYLLVCIILALISLVPYLLAWIFCKKHVAWMIVSLALFSVDTIVLLIDIPSSIAAGDYSIFIDLAVHALVVFELAVGVKAGFAMKREAQEAERLEAERAALAAAAAEAVSTEATEGSESAEAPQSAEETAPVAATTRELTVTRKKSFAGCAVAIVVYVNGEEVCRLKNGQSETIAAPASAFELGASLSNGFAANKQTVEAGTDAVAYGIQIKMGFTSGNVVITRE